MSELESLRIIRQVFGKEDCLVNLETLSSLENEEDARVLDPEDYEFLFSVPDQETGNAYFQNLERFKKILEDIERDVEGVNVRDDCCLQSKSVILRLPRRKFTS